MLGMALARLARTGVLTSMCAIMGAGADGWPIGCGRQSASARVSASTSACESQHCRAREYSQ
eukprot:6342295-Lingulodinium_polyedra.AAC.1